MSITKSDSSRGRKGDDVRAAAQKALSALLEPLAGFVLDTGLSAHEFEDMFRAAAVRSAAERQRHLSGRLSISGIAASTGIPRAEISRILKTSNRRHLSDKQQQATNRILSAWHEDPKYTDSSGSPRELGIFGSGSTFDSLVRAHGRGIPTRAMLDELVRTGSVEITSLKNVRATSLVAVDHGVGARAVKAFGDRATDLLATMLSNMRDPERFRFVSNIEGSIESPLMLPVFRKEVLSRGQNFLAGMRETLFQSPEPVRRAKKLPGSVRVNVTVYYRESDQRKRVMSGSKRVRRNFSRNSGDDGARR